MKGANFGHDIIWLYIGIENPKQSCRNDQYDKECLVTWAFDKQNNNSQLVVFRNQQRFSNDDYLSESPIKSYSIMDRYFMPMSQI